MRLSRVVILLGILLGLGTSVLGDPGSNQFKTPNTKKFPVVSFEVSLFDGQKSEKSEKPDTGAVPADSSRYEYHGSKGVTATVESYRFQQETQAYELLSLAAARVRGFNATVEIGNVIGTAGFVTDNEIGFVKGATFVSLKTENAKPADLNELAIAWADALDKGEGDIPALIKHLPNPEQGQKKAVYLNSFVDLQRLPFQHAVLDAVKSGRNADAVWTTYGPTKVLIVEFNTPQLATENDQRIIARIQELWKLGQPAPTAYRRVGNYSVFVFDAPDEQTAKQLIDQVKYEQVVQWLGENPNILREAQKRYVDTTLGVLVTVLKASGWALVTCLGMGGLIGGLLFTYRRSQQKAVTAYSDAGGMLRLNLDELTPETDPGRLLRERN